MSFLNRQSIILMSCKLFLWPNDNRLCSNFRQFLTAGARKLARNRKFRERLIAAIFSYDRQSSPMQISTCLFYSVKTSARFDYKKMATSNMLTQEITSYTVDWKLDSMSLFVCGLVKKADRDQFIVSIHSRTTPAAL